MENKDNTSIEMQNTKHIYPVISGEIAEYNTEAQPCDTQNTSSHDNDEPNSDNEMLRVQPLKVFQHYLKLFSDSHLLYLYHPR